MNRKTLRFVLIVGTVLMSSPFAAAQQTLSNPHGEIRWECQSCHTPSGWSPLKQPLTFKHPETGYPLLGAHLSLDCQSCHQSLQFEAVGTACADCHTDIHQAQFGNDCATCHSPESWENVQGMLELHSERGFPLTGVHTVLDCQACHVQAVRNEFAGLSPECFTCHEETFQQTDNPSHVEANFSLNCESCHQPLAVTWENARFDHDSDFILEGAHLRADCAACHQTVFAALDQDCFSCHEPQYQSVTFPNHAEMGFPTDCIACHNQVNWGDAVFDHATVSGFELRGVHNMIDCVSCHVNNQLVGLPRDCIGCHQEQFVAVPDPDHVSGGFPEDCLVCHNEVAWRPASFDHNNSDFPLTGAHLSLDCLACHSDGYTNTPADCFSCHDADYNSTVDPNHQAAGFPTACETCHETIDWEQTTWDHDQLFPIYSGKHREAWAACLDCHVEPTNFERFECITCHEHNQADMDDKHDEVGGYVYESQACFDCHPDGEEKRGLRMPIRLDRVRN